MGLRLNDLLYGSAEEAAERLLHAEWPRPTREDMTAALINALNRIARLEKRVADLDAALARARPQPDAPPPPGART